MDPIASVDLLLQSLETKTLRKLHFIQREFWHLRDQIVLKATANW